MTDKEFYAQMSNAPLPTIAQGLLNLEAMRKNGNIGTVPVDVLELPDNERRALFGARIRLMRSLLGMKQKDLAKALNVVQQAVGAYETGRQEPTPRNLIALSRALGVSVDWLIGNDPPPQK